jgi:hypothetical protein
MLNLLEISSDLTNVTDIIGPLILLINNLLINSILQIIF